MKVPKYVAYFIYIYSIIQTCLLHCFADLMCVNRCVQEIVDVSDQTAVKTKACGTTSPFSASDS